MQRQVDAIQWGGGVVAELFGSLQKPTRFSGGGGVVPFILRKWGPFTFLGFPKGGARGTIIKLQFIRTTGPLFRTYESSDFLDGTTSQYH